MSYSDDEGDDMINMESGEDNYLSDNNDEGRDSEDEGFGMEEDSIRNQSDEVSYVVLKEEDIKKRQKEDIERVSTLLCISQVESIVLLLHYHWSVGKIEDEWFTDEDKVRKLVGLFKEPVYVVDNSNGVEIDCGICFDSFGLDEIASVSCGHPYCVTCWTGYIESKINDGLGCLTVKCPEPSCSAAVGQDLILRFAKEEDKEKYYRFLLRSYVENGGKKRTKWCTSPGCECAIDLTSGCENNYDVSCLCSNSFCWNCSEDAHRPVDCETVAKWIFKNNDESENTNWILANTKPCPKCKRQIEKNQGCNHMRCSAPCGFHFCWLCLKSTSDHYACNDFKPNAGNDSNDEADNVRQRAKNAIDKYTHYYERWITNQKSRESATKGLKDLQSEQLKVLCHRQCTSETQLQFTVDAWIQIIEGRRMLKWTYAYGYYIPENEQVKKEFFKYLQGEAENSLEKLHHCVEIELKQFVSRTKGKEGSVPITTSFDEFRRKLIGLTKVNKTFFENLVKAWENGLENDGLIESKSTSTNPSESTNPYSKRQKIGGAGAVGGWFFGAGAVGGGFVGAGAVRGRFGQIAPAGRGAGAVRGRFGEIVAAGRGAGTGRGAGRGRGRGRGRAGFS